MAKHLVSPSLFDVSADIAGEVPVEVIKQWAASDQTRKSHEKILAPFKRRGIVVCSDSAGLSKLTAQVSLVEAMKLVSQPKEIIYSHGRAIGGEPVGIWFADNTEMFYPESVPVSAVVEQMAAAQKEISRLKVQVGMCVYSGEYISLGRGLHGEADVAEELAEAHSSGGEIMVTDKVKAMLPAHFHKIMTPRTDLPSGIHTLHHDKLKISKVIQAEGVYPLPFDLEFHQSISQADSSDKKALEKIHKQFAHDKTVILINVHFADSGLLLEKFGEMVLANKLIHGAAKGQKVEKIKSNGQLGIYVADSPKAALDFARSAKENLTVEDFSCNVGVASGEVLLFRPNKDTREIAGSPVNLASKLAEDIGETGHIYIEKSVANRAGLKTGEPFSVKISGVNIEGVKI